MKYVPRVATHITYYQQLYGRHKIPLCPRLKCMYTSYPKKCRSLTILIKKSNTFFGFLYQSYCAK